MYPEILISPQSPSTLKTKESEPFISPQIWSSLSIIALIHFVTIICMDRHHTVLKSARPITIKKQKRQQCSYLSLTLLVLQMGSLRSYVCIQSPRMGDPCFYQYFHFQGCCSWEWHPIMEITKQNHSHYINVQHAFCRSEKSFFVCDRSSKTHCQRTVYGQR